MVICEKCPRRPRIITPSDANSISMLLAVVLVALGQLSLSCSSPPRSAPHRRVGDPELGHVFVRLGSPESAGGSTNILSSTTHAHSTAVAPIPRTSWIPALSVPPVATRSSTRRTRSPGLTTGSCSARRARAVAARGASLARAVLDVVRRRRDRVRHLAGLRSRERLLERERRQRPEDEAARVEAADAVMSMSFTARRTRRSPPGRPPAAAGSRRW